MQTTISVTTMAMLPWTVSSTTKTQGHDVVVQARVMVQRGHLASAVAKMWRRSISIGHLDLWKENGVSIVANKVNGVRAALVVDAAHAQGAVSTTMPTCCASLIAPSDAVNRLGPG